MGGLIKLTDVKVSPKRQRREFRQAELQEMATSLETVGMLHAPVMRQEADGLYLVAGERRLRAVRDMEELGIQFRFEGKVVPLGFIPFTTLGELTKLEAWEAELEENIRRVDLTWPERAQADAELMALRTAQAQASGKPLPTVTDIAVEIHGQDSGSKWDNTRAGLLVVKHLADPDVAGASSVKEALKVVKKKEQVARHQSMAASMGKNFTAAAHTLINGKTEDVIKTMPSEAFDVILTDPPYGMGADEFGDSGGKAEGAHGYADTAEVLNAIIHYLPQELYRIAKAKAHAYIFCDIEFFRTWKFAMEQAGWNVFRTPMIWFKPGAFRAPWPEMGPQRRYELILYAVKGQKKVNRMAGDVLEFNPDTNLGHGAQKPVELFKELLSRSVTPGDTVVDFFCGSGPIFPAAHALMCKATGVEMDATSYAIAAGRIKELT